VCGTARPPSPAVILARGMLLGCCLAALAGSGFTAARTANDDYAEGLTVTPEHDEPVVRMILPARFYEVSASSDYSDIEVFDADGEPVSFALSTADSTAGSYSDWHDLPVFTAPEPLLTEAVGSSSLAVQVAADGSISGVIHRSVAGGGIPITLEPGAVLVDVTDYPGRLDDLRVDWIDTFEDFTAALRIDGSEDLVTWMQISDQAMIASLHVDGLHIRQQEVALPSSMLRFLRISPADDAALATRIRRVQGRARPQRAQHRAHKLLHGDIVDYARSRGAEFDTGGRFPVDRVSLDPVEPNRAIYARVLSRARPSYEWRLRGQHIFYRIEHGEVAARSAPLSIDRTPDRYWQVELSNERDDDRELTATPVLEISWLPHELIWLRSGPAPYMVAFGRSGMEGKGSGILVDRLRETLDQDIDLDSIPLSSPGEQVTLGGRSAAAPRAAWPDGGLVALIVAASVGVLLAFAVLLRRRRS
jgi:hypothetical protein